MVKLKKEQAVDELDVLEATFKQMDSDKSRVGLALLEEARFMRGTLERLKEEIKNNDMVGEMQQGSYSIMRSNPALKTYNTLSETYRKVMKQIIDILPKESASNKIEEFEEF